MIALKKLRKIFFVSSKKLPFILKIYSNTIISLITSFFLLQPLLEEMIEIIF